MQIACIYTDEVGETHFRDDEVELSPLDFAPPAPPLNVSAPVAAAQLVLIGVPAEWHGDWHPAPRRQYWVGVSGKIRVTVSDGETREFGPGSILLLEDLDGKGHMSHAVGSESAEGLFIQTPADSEQTLAAHAQAPA